MLTKTAQFQDRRAVVRRRKLRRIRAAVRAGVYENPLKLHIAVDRLLDKLLRERDLPRQRLHVASAASRSPKSASM